MANGQYIKGSNGSGEAVRSTVTAARTSGSTVISVNSLTNWPANFIATTGSINTDNSMTVKMVFRGHVDGTTMVIDTVSPGYTDPGSVIGDVIVLKPTTDWADNLQAFLDVAHDDDGNITNGYIGATKIADNSITTAKIVDGAVTAAKVSGMGYQEIGRVTVSSPTATMTVSGLAAYKYLKVVIVSVAATSGSGAAGISLRFNNDTGTNYAYRTSGNGGADITSISQTSINGSNGAASYPSFLTSEISNLPTKEKLLYITSVAANTVGAANLPGRNETAAKWSNTSSGITRIDSLATGTGSYDVGSEMIVYGKN